MSVFDSLKDRFRRPSPSVNRPGTISYAKPVAGKQAVDDMLRADRERARKTFAQQVLDAPTDFNRAARRSIGLFGRLWKWDVNNTDMQRAYVPRYVRRHHARVMLNIESRPASGQHWPRRARKERARVARIIRAKGMA